jgi:hypothetical protein
MTTRVLFDWDYGYRLPLRSGRDEDLETHISAGLKDQLRSWLDVFERGNPSDPSHPGKAWVEQGRALCSLVQAELGPDFTVRFALDRPSGR